MQKRQFLAGAATAAAVSSTPWLVGCASTAGKAAAEDKTRDKTQDRTQAQPVGAEPSAAPADVIYYGGPILTMNDAQRQVEALAVQGARIVAVGDLATLKAWQGPSTRMADLQGRTLIPGFVDPHSHIGGVGLQAISANLLPPPDGPNASIAQLQKTLREYMQTSPEVKQLGMVFGFGYDDSQLKERRHPTRDDLDAV